MTDLSVGNKRMDSEYGNILRDFVERILNRNNVVNPERKTVCDLSEQFPFIKIEQEGGSLEEYVDFIDSVVLPSTAETASPRNFANMSSTPPLFIAELSRLLTFLSQNLMKFNSSGGLTFLEKQLLAMLHDIFYSEKNDFYRKSIKEVNTVMGVVTSCGSISNITALYLALERSGFGSANRYAKMAQDGYQKMVIIGSELMHYSFDRAANLFGIQLLKIPVDRNFRINLNKVKECIDLCKKNKVKVVALIGVAGSTNVGGIDDIFELGELAQREKIFFHVDAAWGGILALSSEHKDKLHGISLADSITIDGHKQFLCPIGLGVLILKNPEDSLKISHYADYAIRKNSMDLGVFSMEGSRPASSIYLHMILKVYGRNELERIINKKICLTKYLESAIRKNSAFELVSSAYTNMLTFRYLPKRYRDKELLESENNFINEFNLRLHELVESKGECVVSRTTLKVQKHCSEIMVLRVVLSNNELNENDVLYMLNELESFAELISMEEMV